jgi:hypothetical protein
MDRDRDREHAVVDPREQSCRLHDEVAGSTLTLLAGKGHMIHYGIEAVTTWRDGVKP